MYASYFLRQILIQAFTICMLEFTYHSYLCIKHYFSKFFNPEVSVRIIQENYFKNFFSCRMLPRIQDEMSEIEIYRSWCNNYRRRKWTRVQIMDEAVYISYSANNLGKDMNFSLHLSMADLAL